MKLFIQNMVSLRCKLLVKSELAKLKIGYGSVELGEVQLLKPISAESREKLRIELHKSGLELIEDARATLIERIINIIIEMVHYSEDIPPVKFSVFLSKKLGRDYHKLSTLFSQNKGITIEKFIALHKIERAKELITYNELSLSEISYRLHYSSVAHLSHQFKQVTGFTPSFFKNLSERKRFPLEDLAPLSKSLSN